MYYYCQKTLLSLKETGGPGLRQSPLLCYCRYDNILRDGLPDWKQPVYYYRRVRKMAFVELFLLLFILICIGHYIIGWAVYFERQLELVSGGGKTD